MLEAVAVALTTIPLVAVAQEAVVLVEELRVLVQTEL
jgi:hypothetical protein